MSAEVTGISDGIVTLRISDRLMQADMVTAQERTGQIIREQGPVRILVIAENFAGWQSGGEWNDFSFQDAYDAHIERMAIVADPRWRDLALLFTAKGLRSFPIEFFTPVQMADARAWLLSR